MSDPLFKDTDAVEQELADSGGTTAQPDIPPYLPFPDDEQHAPPAHSYDAGTTAAEPFFDGVLYENDQTVVTPQTDIRNDETPEGVTNA